jgi:hypothetical protein
LSFIPQHRFLRLVATAWLVVATALLVAMVVRPEMQANDRAALSVLVPLYFMSFPLGHLGLLAANKTKLVLYLDYGGFVPGVLEEGVSLWVALTALGCLQWFVLLPWLARNAARLVRVLSSRGLSR